MNQGSIDFFTGSGTSPNTGTLSSVAALTGVTGSSIVGFDIYQCTRHCGVLGRRGVCRDQYDT
ncbi:MAG: hypothetical protein ABIP20_13805 [Chthoniobacteraceae bacterium]